MGVSEATGLSPRVTPEVSEATGLSPRVTPEVSEATAVGETTGANWGGWKDGLGSATGVYGREKGEAVVVANGLVVVVANGLVEVVATGF